MIRAPDTRYADSGDAQIAYQVVGDGPIDLVFPCYGSMPIDMVWEHPGLARNLSHLASFSRLIQFDLRGFGSSSGISVQAMPAMQAWMDDIVAVLDAAGSERAGVLAASESALPAMLLAASHPERVTALALINGFARYRRGPQYPWGIPDDAFHRLLERYQDSWCGPGVIAALAPSVLGNQATVDWAVRAQRLGAAPADAEALARFYWDTDVTHILPGIKVPTLVVARAESLHVRVGHSRFLAEHIPNSKLVELPGQDTLPWLGEADDILDELEEFLTGARRIHNVDRVLATVLFTDIVGSTEQAADIGDRRWRDLLDAHDAVIRHQLDVYRGRAVNGTGDGVFATFDGPARAIQCATAIRDALDGLGIIVRAGLHTGEVELRNADVGGIAVHIGARIGAMAEAGEVLVSRTVKDLVAGSGIGFLDRGVHALKGIPDEWQVYAVQT